MKSEMLSNRHTDTHTHRQTDRPSTVTFAAHARRGLMIIHEHKRVGRGILVRNKAQLYKL